MKKRRILLVLLSLLLVFLLLACEDDNSDQASNESNDTVEAGEDLSSEEPADTIGKRSNPVPIGEWIEFEDTYYESLESFDGIDGKFKLRITEVERGDEALDKLIEENQFNEPAPDDNEWVIAHFEIEMLDGDEDAPYTLVPFVSVMSSSGNEISQDDWATLDGNEFGHVDLFPGGEHSGRLTMYVPEGDESLLVYEYGFDSAIYFSITE